MAKEVQQSRINIAVDNGNSFVKFCFDKLEAIYSFPNVFLPTQEERKTIQNQGNPLDFLDVEVVSPSLPETMGRHFYIGNLAARYKQAGSIVGATATTMKSKRPETVLTALIAIAYSVAKKNEDKIKKGVKRIRAEVNLGIGLPITEISEAPGFENLFTVGAHTVTFLTTPVFQGVTIELSISMPDGVQVDDVSGMMDIAADRGADLMEKSFGVADIGGVDMDIAFFTPGLMLDDFTAGGVRVDLNDRISKIRENFNQSIGQEVLATDTVVIDRLVKRNYDVRHAGVLVGSIAEVSSKSLSDLAKTVYAKVLDAWFKFPDADEFHFIGGGALILGPYIRDINEKEGKGRPIFFDEDKYSQLRNLRGTFRSLEMALNEKGAAAATAESGDD